jgi:pilus assembly protein FimV
MPIYKSGIDALSFEEFFVYLQGEDGKGSWEQSSKGEGDGAERRKEAANKIDSEIALIASRVRKEGVRGALKEEEIKKSEPQREQTVEIIKHGVVEQKVFVAQDEPEEKPFFAEQGKGTDKPREEEQAEADVPDGSYAQKDLVDTVEPLKEGVTVYEGTILKTMPGFTVIPYEETAGVEILHARMEEKKETKEEYEVEVLEKQEESSKEEVDKENIQEPVEVVEVRKDEKLRKEIEAIKKEIYREKGLLSEDATVTVSSHDEIPDEDLEIQKEAKPDVEVVKGKEADDALPGDEHNTTKTVRTGAPPKIEAGLLIESVQGRMVMPLEDSLSGEPLQIEKETKEEVEAKVEVEEQIKTATQIVKEKETKEEVKVKVEVEQLAEEETQIEIETKEEAEVKVEVEVEVEQQTKAKEHAEAKVETKEEAEAKVEVEEQIKTATQTEEQIQKETEKEAQTAGLKGTDETDVPRVIYFHEETKRTTLAEMDEGLFLETIPGAVTMPFEIEPSGEAVQGGFMEQKGEQELESHEEGKEPVQEFVEVEGSFDRARVEEKLKYLETSEKENMMKLKEEDIVTREHEHKIITEKSYVKNEEQEETETPVVEIVKSSREQVPQETVHDEKGKDTDLKEEGTEKQLSEKRSDEQVIAPDIHEIDAGLLLTSVAGQTTVPFKEDLIVDLPKERAGGGDEIKKTGDTEDKSPLETTGYEAIKIELKNYLDLPQKEEDRKRELEKGTGDEKKGAKMEEATAEYYKKEDVLPKASPFFEKLKEAEEKEVEIQEKAEVKVEVEELEQIQTKIETETKEEAEVKVEVEELEQIQTETETKEKAEVRTPQEIDSKADEIPSKSLEERVVAEVVTPESNRIPSREEYVNAFGEKKKFVKSEIRPESQESIGDEDKEPSFGISMPDVFFKKDIRIEISMNDPGTTEVSFQLMKKAHPLDEKDGSLNQEEIKLVEDTSIDYTLEYKRVFSTAKAEKGIYIFVMKNNGPKRYEAELLFHIFEGKSGERKKAYKTIELPPNTTLKYKFIIPEAVFWDDEGYFTGTIESSKTLTKFNERTGLIWREEKDN